MNPKEKDKNGCQNVQHTKSLATFGANLAELLNEEVRVMKFRNESMIRLVPTKRLELAERAQTRNVQPKQKSYKIEIKMSREKSFWCL